MLLWVHQREGNAVARLVCRGWDFQNLTARAPGHCSRGRGQMAGAQVAPKDRLFQEPAPWLALPWQQVCPLRTPAGT